MRYLRSSMFLAVIILSGLLLVWHLALADPPPKSGNPGLPGCLAEVASKDAQIAELQIQIDQLTELLEQLQNQPPAPVPQTGQTKCYAINSDEINCDGSGQDGELQKGVSWPVVRFTDNEDGTVTDNLTGLVWLKNASCGGGKTWADALAFANSLYDGWTGDGSGGDCGLDDDSLEGDWRLPNFRELSSLIDYGNMWPALPSGHPFTSVENLDWYWSSTTYVDQDISAWMLSMGRGEVNGSDKTNDRYVWPVRGGN